MPTDDLHPNGNGRHPGVCGPDGRGELPMKSDAEAATDIWTGGSAIPEGHRDARRWHLVGAGVSNVWRYGDLELGAASGRLLLRGPNGTGKTTALEMLCPYLLDLEAKLLAAGKARTTSLGALMAEGSDGKRRVGYLWISFAQPGIGAAGEQGADAGASVMSYGVRLTYSPGASPPVRVASFRVLGVPLRDVSLWGPNRAALNSEAFTETVEAAGGAVFADEEAYRRDLASRVFRTTVTELRALVANIRRVRNPSVLGDLSPERAAQALRDALPGVNEEVIVATGAALAESDETRRAFERDEEAAASIGRFARVWSGHVRAEIGGLRDEAHETSAELERTTRAAQRATRRLAAAEEAHGQASGEVARLDAELTELRGTLHAIEQTEDYRAAGRLDELQQQERAQAETARTHRDLLHRAVREAVGATTTTAARAADVIVDLHAVTSEVARAAASFVLGEPIVVKDVPARAVMVGDESVEIPAFVAISADPTVLDVATIALRSAATAAVRDADTAKLLLLAHRDVADAQREAHEAKDKAARSAAHAEGQARRALAAGDVVTEALEALNRSTYDWYEEAHRAIAKLADPRELEVAALPVGRDDLDEIAWSEAAGALADLGLVSELVGDWSRDEASRTRARATKASEEAAALRQEASALRDEAIALRSGDIALPFPRPSWAGPGDDTTALAGVLEWDDDVPGDERDRIEAALGAAGALGATVVVGAADHPSAMTNNWTVTADGPELANHLGRVVHTDQNHPLAEAVNAILTRIALIETVSRSDQAGARGAGLVVGRDGSFRAGVLIGRPVSGEQPARRAEHIGAAQRRAAAFARADELDGRAHQLDLDALAADERAQRADAASNAIVECARAFPDRTPVAVAEAARANAAEEADEAARVAANDEQEAAQAAEQADSVERDWTAKVNSQGLVADVDLLDETARDATTRAQMFTTASDRIEKVYRARVESIQRDAASALELHDGLDGLALTAGESRRAADETAAKLETLRATAGDEIASVLARHDKVRAALSTTDVRLNRARQEQLEAVDRVATRKSEATAADGKLAAAKPLVQSAMAELRSALSVPGVTDVIAVDKSADDSDLLDQIGAQDPHPTATVRQLRSDYETTKAELAGLWALDPGAEHAHIETYTLTHDDVVHTPVGAADVASTAAARARDALAAADQKALDDFVIARLPNAVADAWVSLQVWVREVNAKMKMASASSGVGVSVRVKVRDDLPDAEQTVYDLCCAGSDVRIDSDLRAIAGEAIKSLIDLSDDPDMTQRVRHAVDIPGWLEVTYMVERPGEAPRKWGRRTGLSGGERRLIVLAPMLAAVAAECDRFPAEAARLCALDEIPSEVDEAGREGLARYLAALDVDLLATSHHWDGAPGAWDGIDAWDLEAAPDGTVVAFPMLVRAAPTAPVGSVP